eukprot:scaffold187813_cov80-Cyclotella_meneghiniana.AAC.4
MGRGGRRRHFGGGRSTGHDDQGNGNSNVFVLFGRRLSAHPPPAQYATIKYGLRGTGWGSSAEHNNQPARA